MIQFTIPKGDWKALTDLLWIEPEKREAFIRIIKDPAKVPHADDFAKHFAETTGKDRKEADKYIGVLFKLYSLYDTSGKDIDSNLSLIMDYFKNIDSEVVKKASDAHINLFKSFLKDVLSLHDTIGIRAKANRLMPQHQHIFKKSEIYSDIRPIFRPEHIDFRPSGAVFIHSLKIRYYEGFEQKEIFFGLSDNDLRQLKETVERAIQKHNTLKIMIGGFDIQCVE
jgi:hypothetical protein